jgi:hypothetical protein
LKLNFLSQNSTFGNDNNKNIDNKREKQIGIIKNITNILPHRDSNHYNIKINHYKKKEKSMDYRNNPQNLFFLNYISSNGRQNEDSIFKDSNRKYLSPVKMNSNLYKNRRNQLCETDIYRNDYNKNTFRMNDKLIINLTNDGEKNISLLKIRQKIQSREKDRYNNKFFTPNIRVKDNNNFPVINSPKNTPPKYEKIKYNKNYKNDKRYFIKNLNFNKVNNNNTNNKEKDYLHHLYNLKMKNHSPKL